MAGELVPATRKALFQDLGRHVAHGVCDTLKQLWIEADGGAVECYQM